MLAPGTRVGEYLLVRCVAVGATSEVHAGRHATSGVPVAVKVLSPEWCLHPEVVARFLNEARTLQELRHPHLVRALASGVLPEGPPFMVLEWQPEDLHHALAREGGRLAVQDCVQVLRQLAEVLALLHSRGLVHRDLKPANVLVAHREPGAWRVQLSDLGLAKRLATGSQHATALPVSTAGSALLGTWDYMAPEQWAHSKTVDDRADVYSLGVLGFQLLTGRLPFIAGGQQGLAFCHVVQPPPLELLEGLAPVALRSLLARLLDKKAPARPSMTEVLSLLPPAGG
ncbi:serine/threonine-protein kinase [Archangium sp.]|uniref:serine/threonine-protein kinase n=1 Tax=Archangium sp. TaxID=1872627 RepID=UPI00286A4D39|nr:serine/threonine-protein kinase [Archangium sp.]